MASRSQQTKLLKLKRRGKFSRFSGAAVNLGRGGTNRERMQQYYNSVKPDSFKQPVPVRTGPEMASWLGQYSKLLEDTPTRCRLNLAVTNSGRLDLFFDGPRLFFVEVNYKEEFFRYSREYMSKQTAMDRLKNNRITWVETISPE